MWPLSRRTTRAVLSLRSSVAVAIVGAVIGTAKANIDPAGYQTMSPFRCPEFGGPGIQFGVDQEGNGVRLRYGWGATKRQHLDHFLQVQSGTVTLTGPNGFSITDQWSVGSATGWTAPPYTQGTGIAPSGKQVPIFRTDKFTNFGTNLPAGDYSLTMDLQVSQAVPDGYHSTGPGSWLKVTNCPVTIGPGPLPS